MNSLLAQPYPRNNHYNSPNSSTKHQYSFNRLLDPHRRTSSWLITRKSSQDSNLSSSRNDSSGSGTTASTSTWRISRSSASLDISSLRGCSSRPKPRLTRQLAIQEPDSPGSPGRLAVRLLATIPSAAEMSEQCDEESSALAEPQKEEEDGDAEEEDVHRTEESKKS